MMKKLVKKMLIILSVAAMALSMTACADMIVAPIAANTAKNVMGEANISNHKSDAASVDNACKTLCLGIRSGTITSSSSYPDGSPVTCAAEPEADPSLRNSYAANATVADALKYNGLIYTNISGMFFKESDGTIEYFGNSAPSGYEKLELDTIFLRIYANKYNFHI